MTAKMGHTISRWLIAFNEMQEKRDPYLRPLA